MPSWDAITNDAALSAIPATLPALAAPEHPPAILGPKPPQPSLNPGRET